MLFPAPWKVKQPVSSKAPVARSAAFNMLMRDRIARGAKVGVTWCIWWDGLSFDNPKRRQIQDYPNNFITFRLPEFCSPSCHRIKSAKVEGY
jgi:hypothetical protein